MLCSLHLVLLQVVEDQVIRIHRYLSSKHNFNEACSVLFSAVKHRGYSSRFLRKMKSEIDNPSVSTKPYKPYKIRHNLRSYVGRYVCIYACVYVCIYVYNNNIRNNNNYYHHHHHHHHHHHDINILAYVLIYRETTIQHSFLSLFNYIMVISLLTL